MLIGRPDSPPSSTLRPQSQLGRPDDVSPPVPEPHRRHHWRLIGPPQVLLGALLMAAVGLFVYTNLAVKRSAEASERAEDILVQFEGNVGRHHTIAEQYIFDGSVPALRRAERMGHRLDDQLAELASLGVEHRPVAALQRQTKRLHRAFHSAYRLRGLGLIDEADQAEDRLVEPLLLDTEERARRLLLQTDAISNRITRRSVWLMALAVGLALLAMLGLGRWMARARAREAQALAKHQWARLRNEALEARLQQSQRLEIMGQLAGGIAHDFNNLLGVIINYTAFISQRVKDDEVAMRDLREVQQAAERAALLTRQLLAFSRREPIRPEAIDLNEVVEEMESMLRRTIGEHIELNLKLASSLSPVLADRGQLDQVVMNLVVNARDAMPKGGRLEIATETLLDPRWEAAEDRRPGRCVRLTVTDTGCGMDEAVATRAFDPFFTTKPRDQGAGLGLATVYGIVRQAGGHIELDSTPGIGTSVAVYLPVAGHPAPVAREDRDEAPYGRGETILVVEDEDAVRQVTCRMLADQGYEVLNAQDGKEAIRVYGAHEDAIDLLLTDVVMPKMSGKELVQRLTALGHQPKVIYMSGYTEDIISHHGILDEGIEYLAKPFTGPTLLAKVQEALDQGPSR